MIGIILLQGGQTLRSRSKRLIGIERIRLIEVGLCPVVLRKLDVENAARCIQRSRLRFCIETGGHHVHTNLIRLVVQAKVREVDVEIYIVRCVDNSLAKSANRIRSISIGLKGCGRELEHFDIGSAFLDQRLQSRNRVFRTLRNHLRRRQSVAGSGARCGLTHAALEYCNCLLRIVQPDQAIAVVLQGIRLGIQERTALLKMPNRDSAAPLPISYLCKHGVTDGIAWPQCKNVLQQRGGILIIALIFNLRCPLQGSEIVRLNSQCVAKCAKRRFLVSFAGKGDSLQGPELCIPRALPKLRLQKLNRFVEFACLQCGCDGRDPLCAGLIPIYLRNEPAGSGQHCSQNGDLKRKSHVRHYPSGTALYRNMEASRDVKTKCMQRSSKNGKLGPNPSLLFAKIDSQNAMRTPICSALPLSAVVECPKVEP